MVGLHPSISLPLSLTPSLPPVLQIQLKKKEDEALLVAPYSRSYGRTMVSTILDSESGGAALVGRTVRVGGWVKTGRVAGAGSFAFLEVNDGSCFANLQVMVDAGVAEEVGGLKALVPTSTCVLIEGVLSETPEGTKQKVRMRENSRLFIENEWKGESGGLVAWLPPLWGQPSRCYDDLL